MRLSNRPNLARFVLTFTLALAATTHAAPTLSTQADLDPTQPTLVTLKLSNVPPKDVFAELSRQIGSEFPTLPPNLWEKSAATPISIDQSNQPFWLAMKDACAKTGISLKYATDTDQPRIILTRDNQTWTDFPTVTTGPFLVSLIGLHRASTIDMRKPADVQKTFFVKFTVFCEPRFKLLQGSLNARIEQATDDKNNVLAPAAKADEAPLNFITSWVYNLEGKLEYPATPGTKIPLLRASANFVAQVKSETIQFPDPLEAKEAAQSVAGRKITLNQLRRTPDEYEAKVTFARDQLPPDQWEKTIFPGNAMRLVDSQGHTLAGKGFGLGTKADQATYVFKFEKESTKPFQFGKPTKLTWEIPTQTRQIPMTVEFKDVPLP